MEGIAILIVLGLIVLVFVLPIAAMVRSGNAKQLAESFAERLREIQARARAQEEKLWSRIHELERWRDRHGARDVA